jgi:hypothetical protein
LVSPADGLALGSKIGARTVWFVRSRRPAYQDAVKPIWQRTAALRRR